MTALSATRAVQLPRWPLRRLAQSLSAALAVLWLLALTPAGDFLLAPLNIWTAQATAAMSAAVGLPLIREGTVLVHASGFACLISFACTAVIPVALLAAAIGPWPASRRRRAIGIAIGALLLLLVNQLRLTSLVWVGVYAPEYFDVAHAWVGPSLLTVTTAGYWFVWSMIARNNSA